MQSRFEILKIKNWFIEESNYPFWIKEYVDGKFIMRYLNRAYENRYLLHQGVKKEQYIGATDFDIYPKAIADVYFNHDMNSYNSKSSTKFNERTLIEGGEKIEVFMKAYIKDNNTEKEYIVGMSVES